MSFDKHSNFNKQANFTEVKFGENKPVLEVELNELQQIQNEARANIVRDSIPSGFTQLGEIDYDYCLNNENKIKLKTDSVAYVNGYRINIPKDTIIDIGKAPEKEAREDLLFLEVWKEEVTSDSVLTVQGGEGQSQIANNIKDSRYPIETTHRVALKWRIRHVADVDFSYYPDGFHVSGTVWRGDDVIAQGGNEQPLDRSNTNSDSSIIFSSIGLGNSDDIYRNINFKDVGLYMAGRGRASANLLKTVDGYVYAIPMFRLYRKPSCGKSIPFEYSKINPKVDYNKFTKLMKEDKVERVISENIQGRSLVNFAYATSITLTKNLYSPLTHDGIIKSNTEYTLSFNISNITGSATGKILRLIIRPTGGSDDTSNDITINVTSSSFTTGKVKVKIPSQTVSIARLYIHLSGGTNGDSIALTDVMILEGDWTSKEIPTTFSGLKSLGEDDGNLITLKNEILNEDTYDINDGNQKLVSFPEVTHVSSTNSLIPTVEANILKGEESTPLEKLGTKLVTDGTEIVEFTKIKGKTLQNLAMNPVVNNSAVIYKNNICEVPYTASNLSGIVFDKLLKPNTTYTYIMNVLVNDIDNDNVNSVKLQFGDGGEYASLGRGVTGMVVAKITTSSNVSENFGILVRTQGATSGRVKFQGFIVLEGDYTTTPLEEIPFVEGIKSVGETENNIINLTSVGKNLISKDMYTNNWFMGDSVDVDRYNTTGKLYSIYGIKTFGRKPLTLSCNKPFNRMVFRGKDSSGNIIYQGDLGTISKTSHVFNDIPSEVVTLDLYVHSEGIDYTYDFMLEEGKVVNPYEPYKVYNQNIYLKEPLRSLPNGVCDEIVGNKVIRRVGKVVLNGTESWTDNGNNSGRDYVIFYTRLDLKNSTSILSDRFPCKIGTMNGGETYNALGTNGTYSKLLYLCIKRTELSEASASGVKSWLSSKPTTVYYELDTSVEEYLENVYEKESIKTYQLDAPLRSLPNGTKDEIKDGVLIRRCGELVYKGSENWESVTSNDREKTILFNILKDSSMQSSHVTVSDKVPSKYVWSLDEEGLWIDNNGRLYISILKTKLSTVNLDGFKSWLATNTLKLIYPLATPTETILTEAKPQTADFSLQRQFAEGNWLRELPNGVKDTVENGKVIRRVGKVILNGSETFYVHENSNDTTLLVYNTEILKSLSKENGGEYNNVLSDRFNHIRGAEAFSPECTQTCFYLTNTRNLYFRIPKSQLSSNNAAGFKQWLQSNPVTVLYELATSTEEALSTDNYMSYPCHDFNTYCGSMYVGQGRNHVVNENKMPSEDVVIVDTPFRSIEGKAKVEDCKYKKCADGYSLSYSYGKGKNIINPVEFANHVLKSDPSATLVGNILTFESSRFSQRDCVFPFKSCGRNTTLTCSASVKKVNGTGALYFGFAYDDASFDTEVTYTDVFKTIKATSNPSKNLVGLFFSYSVGSRYSIDLNTLQVELGNTATPYENFIPTTKYLENTESNDIEDLRHLVSLTGFNYDKILNESFDKLLRGEL